MAHASRLHPLARDGKHLRRLIADARKASEGPAKQKIGNELKSATRAIQRSAESFGESKIARTAAGSRAST